MRCQDSCFFIYFEDKGGRTMRGIRASASVRKKSKSYGIVTEYSLRGGSRSLNPTLVGLHRLQRISPNARKSALSESTDEKNLY